ncbi:MAG TPA: carboxypeptidase-like regulatory domain-containing protein, partial [Thermoanaerobaculia bacterium]
GRITPPGAHSGVEVVAFNVFDGDERSTWTAADGTFAFEGLPAGMYEVRALLDGFDTTTPEPVLLHRGELREVVLAPTPTSPATMGILIVVPETLRQSFGNSDLVVLATAGPTVLVARHEEEGYREVETQLLISSTLKGKAPNRSVRLQHAEAETATEDAGTLAPGTRLLAFLSARDENGRGKPVYEAEANGYGVKAVSAAEEEAYGERLGALARLKRSGANHPADLAEWLVSTVEQPATRLWAAADLRDALGDLKGLAARRGISPEQAAEELRSVGTQFVGGGSAFKIEPPPALVAAFLTDSQKVRLNKAFQTTRSFTRADLELFTIVRGWAGDAALPWLARNFRTVRPEASGLDRQGMELLADELDDSALKTSLAKAKEESDDYEDTLADRPEAERLRLMTQHAETIDNELRHRFAQVLGAKW